MDCLTYCFCVIFVALLWLWLSIYFYLPLVSSEAACIAKQCPQGCRLKPSGEAECFCSLGYRMRPDSSCEGTSILKLYYIFIECCISAMLQFLLILWHVFKAVSFYNFDIVRVCNKILLQNLSCRKMFDRFSECKPWFNYYRIYSNTIFSLILWNGDIVEFSLLKNVISFNSMT